MANIQAHNNYLKAEKTQWKKYTLFTVNDITNRV